MLNQQPVGGQSGVRQKIRMRLQQRAKHGSGFFSGQDVKAMGLLSRAVGPRAGRALPARTRLDPSFLATARTRPAGFLRAHRSTRVQHWLAQSGMRFEVRQLRPTKPQRDRAGLPRFSVDESARVQRLDHLMHDWRRHLEEGFGNPTRPAACREACCSDR